MDLLSNNSKYIQINLSDIIKAIGEDGAKSILSSFSCPNKDVENFLRYKAIEFSKRDFSKTHLVFWSTLDETEKYLVGYYTIAPKFFSISKDNVSNSQYKKLSQYGEYDTHSKKCTISAILIGQLGKNYTAGNDTLITGDELLKMALDKVKNIQPPKKQPVKKGVYEDHYILRYVKYAIVIVIVIAIICVLGYSFIFTNSKDAKFENSNPSQTETSDNIKKNTTKDTKKSTTKKKTTKKQTTSEITFTKNADGDYSFKLPEGYEGDTFKLKVDFTFATTVDLHVNGDTNSYQTDTFKRGVYSSNLANISASDALKDDSACESVELEFNVNDFQYLEFSYSWNLGHRYYINDQKIPLEESDHNGTRSNGKVRTFKLTLDK